ncbi:MAG: hypothetical protein IKU90_06505 [Clostridia bacterium]|nr:hypothetical protein [Clostridia bacterium]
MDLSLMKPYEWRKFYIPEADCAFGGDYCIHVRKGDPKRLMIFLGGGGVSWDAESAKWPNTPETAEKYHHVGLYTICADTQPDVFSIQTSAADGFHSATEENPLRDWSEVMIPYATGDFHTGTGDLTFTAVDGSEKILHHHGYTNLLKILNFIRPSFPHVEQLLICGESAGAFGTAATAGDIMDAFPECDDVTILVDSAIMSYDWSGTVRNIWQSPPHVADAVKTDNMVTDWLRALYKKYGNKPRYLFSCGCRDHILIMFRVYAETGNFIIDPEHCEEFRGNLKRMCEDLRALSPRFSIYVHDFMADVFAPGVLHCIFGHPTYLNCRIDGVTPAKWLTDAMAGNGYDVGLGLLEG